MRNPNGKEVQTVSLHVLRLQEVGVTQGDGGGTTYEGEPGKFLSDVDVARAVELGGRDGDDTDLLGEEPADPVERVSVPSVNKREGKRRKEGKGRT